MTFQADSRRTKSSLKSVSGNCSLFTKCKNRTCKSCTSVRRTFDTVYRIVCHRIGIIGRRACDRKGYEALLVID